MTFIPLTGASSGGSKPSNWTVRERLRNITKALTAGSSLDLRFAEKFFYQNDALYPAMELMATHSRTSSAWYPNWDFKSGSEVGRLVEYGADERRYGDYGALDEGASTNQIRNPRGEGEADSVPTHWGQSSQGTTVTHSPGALQNGWPGHSVRFEGTPTGDTNILFEQPQQVAASNGQSWTFSVTVAVLAGDLTNIDGIKLRLDVLDSGGASLETLREIQDVMPDAGVRRYASTWTLSNASTAYVRPRLELDWDGAGDIDVTLGIYAPQLEQSSTATSPILPTAGTPAAATRAADVVSGVTTDRASRGWLDTEWDRTNGGACGDLLEFLPGVPRVGPKGLRVEEGSTNHIRNPRCEGGGASALPTNWNLSGQAPTSYAYGTENGWPYVDLVYSGVTPSGSTAIYFEQNTQVSATTGEDWTTSLGAKLISGSLDNVSQINIRSVEYTSGGGVVTAANSADLKSKVGATHTRLYDTRTTDGGGTTAHLKTGIILNHTSGSWTFTLRIYAPQLEQKAFPTSVILPEAGSPAAATRAAEDTLDIAHGPWANGGGEFTVYLEATGNSLESSYPTYVSVGTDANNFVSLAKNAAGSDDHYVSHKNAGVSEMTYVGGPSGADSGSIIRFALRARDNDARYVLSIEGVTDTVADTAISFVGLTEHKIGLGSSLTASARGSIDIQSFRYWPTGLADSALDALVA